MRGPGPVRRNRDAARPPVHPTSRLPRPPRRHVPRACGRHVPRRLRPRATPRRRFRSRRLVTWLAPALCPGSSRGLQAAHAQLTPPACLHPAAPAILRPPINPPAPSPLMLAPCPRESESRLTSGPLVTFSSSRPLICFFITSLPSSCPLVTSPRPLSCPLATSSLLFLPYALSSRLLICFFITASRHVL